MRIAFIALIVVLAATAQAASGPYDETANAKAQVRAALAQAAQAQVPVLVVFGANWCGDCKVLDLAFTEGASAPLVASRFRVVKVDVGRFDRNTDIAESCGVPLLNSGIPAVAVLSSQGEVIYSTRAGELADARKMGDQGIFDFFCDDGPVVQRLEQAFGDVRIDHLRIALRVTTTDASTGARVVLREGALVPALRASIALPFMFSPVHLDGRRLIDGFVADPLPVSAAIDAKAVLALGFESPMPYRIDGPSRMLAQVTSALTNNLMQARLAEAQGAAPGC
jgi:protein disulfide-isomerase